MTRPRPMLADPLAMTRGMAHREFMAKQRWSDLDPRVRRVMIIGGAAEGALKIAALIDLKRRASASVNGPKIGWAAAITLINSVGAVPILYFRYGRRKAPRAV